MDCLSVLWFLSKKRGLNCLALPCPSFFSEYTERGVANHNGYSSSQPRLPGACRFLFPYSVRRTCMLGESLEFQFLNVSRPQMLVVAAEPHHVSVEYTAYCATGPGSGLLLWRKFLEWYGRPALSSEEQLPTFSIEVVAATVNPTGPSSIPVDCYAFAILFSRILHHSCNLGLSRALHHVQQRAVAPSLADGCRLAPRPFFAVLETQEISCRRWISASGSFPMG